MYTATNAHRRIRSHLAFVLNRAAATAGSGVLLTVGDHSFVLSAAHVLEGNIEIQIGQSHPLTPLTILNKWVDQKLDVGYVELKPFEVKIFLGETNSPFVPRSRGPAIVPARKTTLALCGFPFFLKKMEAHRLQFESLFLTLAHLSYSEWPSAIKDKFDPSIHFIIPFGPKHKGTFTDNDDNVVSSIDPHGLSGSGLWFLDPDKENDENPRYSLVGIQHSYEDFYQVLIGTLLTPLLDRLNSDYSINIPPSDTHDSATQNNFA